MAAIFQLRRGTTGDKPTLTAGELYVDQTSENLIVGVNGSKEITLLKLNDINTGSLTLTGDIQLNGNIYLGDNLANDSVNVNSPFSGSLIPSGSNVFDLGSTTLKYRNVYATNISGAIAATNGVVSGSSQITSILDSLNSFSSSQLTQNSALATITGSLILTASANTISITNLNSFSGSQLTQNIALATISGSLILTASNHEQRLGEIESKSGSYDTRFNSLATISGSLISTASANTISITNLNSFSSSQLTENSNLATITGSLISTASANVLSIAELNSYTASLKTAIGVSGQNVTISGDLTVNGTTTAVNSTTIQLGDNIIELNGTGIANGGLLVKDPTGGSTLSGSLLWDSTNDYWKGGTLSNESKLLRAGGDSVISSSAQLGDLNAFTASVTSSLVSIYQTTASLNLFSASVTSSLVSIYQTTASLNTATESLYTSASLMTASIASLTASVVTLQSFSGNVNTRFDNLQTYTTSVDGRFTRLENYTGSVNQTTQSLNSFTESTNTRLGLLEASTGSLNTFSSSTLSRLTLLETSTGSLNLFSASVTSSLISIYQTTSSLQSATGSLFLSASRMTASIFAQEGRITYLEGIAFGGIDLSAQFLAIQQVTSSLHLHTASANIRLNNIEAATSSYETNGRGIWSGSAQLPTGVVSGSLQVLGGSGVWSSSAQMPAGVISGSLQVLGGSGVWSSSAQMPAGVVSGSSQVNIYDLENFGTFNDAISGDIDGKEEIASATHTIVSGSSQVISLLPNGVISGSSQISSVFEPIASSTRTLVSGSTQVLGGSGVWSSSVQMPAGVVSGSSQILGGSGLFSSSVQIGNYVATIAGTANQILVAGSGLNNASVTLSTPQNIDSTATPTFAGLTINGAITATGDITAYYTSDERLKENIQPIQNALSKVETISGNEYDWKEGFEEIHTKKGNDIGVIAQEIQKILPQAVIERDNGYLGVNYEKIIPLLIEAIKELSVKVDRLENK